MTHNPKGKERLMLALLLGMLATLGPLNIDMYLPSFPSITADLETSASMVQLSLTACLIGLAFGQLVIGPISDAKGRRKPLLISILLFAAASFLCAVAPNITTLIIARFLQGATASAGVVLSRAVVRDTFSGSELTKFFALLMVINAVAPLVAPIAGGGILLFPAASWHWIFIFLGLIGLMIFLIVFFRLKESLPMDKRRPSTLKSTFETMGNLVRDRSFISYALIVGFVHGGSFAYVSGTPFVYQEIYGVSPQVFSILFGMNGLAIITGSSIVGRLGGRIPEKTLLKVAVTIAAASTFILLMMTVIKGPLALIVIPIFIYMLSMGMVLTSSFTLAMEFQGHRAGSASAILGMLPLVVGAIVSPLVGLNESTAIPMGMILFVTSLIGFICYFTLANRAEINQDKCTEG